MVATAWSTSKIINLNIVILYFYKLMALIYNNCKETLFRGGTGVISGVFEKGKAKEETLENAYVQGIKMREESVYRHYKMR